MPSKHEAIINDSYKCFLLLSLSLSLSLSLHRPLFHIQYRFKMQQKAIQPFLDYFRDTKRLVTVDVSSGAMEPIWDKIHDILHSFGLVAWRPVESVLVFAMGEYQ